MTFSSQLQAIDFTMEALKMVQLHPTTPSSLLLLSDDIVTVSDYVIAVNVQEK